MTCYCDGTAHAWRPDYCDRFPTHDPHTAIERGRARLRAAKQERAAEDGAL